MARCLFFLLMATSSFAGPEIVSIPEMQHIAALEPTAADRSPPKKAPLAFRQAWKALSPRVTKLVTPELVRSLSRWAKPQMESYVRVAPLDAPKWTVDRVTPEGRLVLSAHIETLPTHAAIVTRWLELVASFDPATAAIERVWITIRGQAEE